MARVCTRCGKSYAPPTTFCTDDGAPLTEGATAVAAVAATAFPTGDSGAIAMPDPRTVEGGPLTRPATAAAPAFEEPQMVALEAGVQVGEYVVEKQIGEGGMGVIFSARHPI